ncbi:hypothetical protein [Kitasatospora sp. A2-31]|uniref:hypothetical protein n=1 Tax=Kitasatospora sp. A2-31 TaxID=2916414 RepID=UPI001EECC98A|nr:hypothetical protein [Kitasatospora sp. A2-31]MCG6495695.1 hypothetical protein [Kitasatospora sp. A2-31]
MSAPDHRAMEHMGEGAGHRQVGALGQHWDPTMLDYGRHDHGLFVYGIGDWSPPIASGHIQAATPPPADTDIAPLLTSWCQKWGYTP